MGVRKGSAGMVVIILAILILVVAGAIYVGRGLFVAATVNGKMISRFELIRKAERAVGQQILEQLISEQLVIQEAEKRGIKIPEEELQNEVKRVEREYLEQGEDLDDTLASVGSDRKDLKRSVEVELLLKRMVNVKVTEEEVDKYAQNRQLFPTLSEEERRAEAREEIKRQKNIGQSVELVRQLRDEADIKFFVNY